MYLAPKGSRLSSVAVSSPDAVLLRSFKLEHPALLLPAESFKARQVSLGGHIPLCDTHGNTHFCSKSNSQLPVRMMMSRVFKSRCWKECWLAGAGDVTKGDGTGGASIFGPRHTVRSAEARLVRGTVAMVQDDLVRRSKVVEFLRCGAGILTRALASLRKPEYKCRKANRMDERHVHVNHLVMLA
eukprot:1141438-Pelagomonas_calceolata.AAC.2